MYILFIVIDNDVKSFIPQHEKAYQQYEVLNKTYGNRGVILIGIGRKYTTITEAEMLSQIAKLTRELEQIPSVEEVLSLTNMVVFSVDKGQLNVRAVFDDIPQASDEIKKRLQLLREWDFTNGIFISASQKSAQIFVTVKESLSASERELLYDNILTLIGPLQNTNDTTVYVTGEPIINIIIGRNMMHDAFLLLPLVVIVMVVILALFFRTAAGIVFPLLTVAIAIIWTLGLMSVFSRPLTLLGSVIPVVLVAVGSAYGIHYVYIYYQKKQERLSYQDTIFETVRTVGFPVMLAALTTFIGFSSLGITILRPVRDFGAFVAIGVLFSVLVLFLLVPGIQLLIDRRKERTYNKSLISNRIRLTGQQQWFSSFFTNLYRLLLQERFLILTVTVIFIFFAILGMRKVVVDNNVIDYFPSDSDVAQSDVFFSKEFQGIKNFNINVVGEKPGDLINIEILIAMDELKKHLRSQYKNISAVHSFTDIIKRINQVVQTSTFSSYETAEIEGDQRSGAEEDDLASFFEEDKPRVKESRIIEPSGQATIKSKLNLQRNENITREFLAMLRDMGTNDVAEIVQELLRTTGVQSTQQYYEIPQDPQKYKVKDVSKLQDLIAQYLFLFAGNMSAWIDNDFSPRSARMIVQMAYTNSHIMKAIKDDIEKFAANKFPASYKVEVSGTAFVEQRITEIILGSQIISIVVSLSAVVIILWIFFRSLLVGLLGSVPVLLALLNNFSIIGWMGIPLDISTAMVASCAIGIGIDYAIHYLATYRRTCALHKTQRIIELTVFQRTGGAIFFNAFSVAGGFLVLVFSQFLPLRNLGLLVALNTLVAGGASVTLLPVLLGMVSHKNIFRIKEKKK